MSFEGELKKISDITKSYLMLTDEDIQRIRKIKNVLLENSEEIVSGTVGSLLSCELALEFVKKANLTEEQAKKLFKHWFLTFLEGSYDLRHAKEVFRIGLAHARYGVHRRLMCMCMGAWIREILKVIKAESGRIDELVPIIASVSKLIFWNLVIMLHGYHVARVEGLKRAAGISPQLIDRLFRVKADEVYKSLLKRM